MWNQKYLQLFNRVLWCVATFWCFWLLTVDLSLCIHCFVVVWSTLRPLSSSLIDCHQDLSVYKKWERFNWHQFNICVTRPPFQSNPSQTNQTWSKVLILEPRIVIVTRIVIIICKTIRRFGTIYLSSLNRKETQIAYNGFFFSMLRWQGSLV